MRRNDGRVFQWYRANLHSDIARFSQSLRRVEALVRSGRFRELAEATREGMRRMLAVLYRRLSELQRRAVMRFAGAFLALGLIAAPLGAETITFQEQTGAANPFDDLTFSDRAALAFVDVDEDGDDDAVVGLSAGPFSNGALQVFRRSGAGFAAPESFGEAPGLVAREVSPVGADVDADGDTDIVVGAYGYYYYSYGDGRLMLYRRNEMGGLDLESAPTNPLHAVAVDPVFPVFPAFADIDGDGDEDLVVNGNNDYHIVRFYQNDGGSPPGFTETYPTDDLGTATFASPPAAAFVDIDNDGDLDAFVGEGTYYGGAAIRFFENTGTVMSPDFLERTGAANPLDGFAGTLITDHPQPAFTDFDADGDMDVFVGGKYRYYVYEQGYHTEGRIQYFRNTTPPVVTAAAQSATDAAGQSVTAKSNKFAGAVYIVLDGTAQATVADLDAAVALHKAAKATVAAANTGVQIPTTGLVAGTYRAYARSGGATPELSAVGASTITITSSVPPEEPPEEPPVEPPTVTYPTSAGLDASDVWIERVTIGSLVHLSGTNNGYGDNTAESVVLERGTDVTIELVPGFKTGARYSIRRLGQQIWRVWVDWNQDGDFADEGETVVAAGPSQRTVSATIQVPQSALLGSTRIRVSMKRAEDGEPLATGTFASGEVEDYSASVSD